MSWHSTLRHWFYIFFARSITFGFLSTPAFPNFSCGVIWKRKYSLVTFGSKKMFLLTVVSFLIRILSSKKLQQRVSQHNSDSKLKPCAYMDDASRFCEILATKCKCILLCWKERGMLSLEKQERVHFVIVVGGFNAKIGKRQL